MWNMAIATSSSCGLLGPADLRGLGDKPNQPSSVTFPKWIFGELKPWPHHNLFSTPSPDYIREPCSLNTYVKTWMVVVCMLLRLAGGVLAVSLYCTAMCYHCLLGPTTKCNFKWVTIWNLPGLDSTYSCSGAGESGNEVMHVLEGIKHWR